MGKLEDLIAKQDQIDNVIGEVKKDLDYIKGQLSGSEGGLNADEVAALDARLDATLAKIKGLDEETDSSGPVVEG